MDELKSNAMSVLTWAKTILIVYSGMIVLPILIFLIYSHEGYVYLLIPFIVLEYLSLFFVIIYTHFFLFRYNGQLKILVNILVLLKLLFLYSLIPSFYLIMGHWFFYLKENFLDFLD